MRGRRHLCRGAEADSLGPEIPQKTIEILPLQYIDKVIDVVVQVQQVRAQSWVTVEIPQLQLVSSWTMSLTCPLCATTRAVVVDVLAQFIDKVWTSL